MTENSSRDKKRKLSVGPKLQTNNNSSNYFYIILYINLLDALTLEKIININKSSKEGHSSVEKKKNGEPVVVRNSNHSKTISTKTEDILINYEKKEIQMKNYKNTNNQTSMELTKVLKPSNIMKKPPIDTNNQFKNSNDLAGNLNKDKDRKKVVIQNVDHSSNPVNINQGDKPQKSYFKSNTQIPKVELVIGDGKVTKTQQSPLKDKEKPITASIITTESPNKEKIMKTQESPNKEKLKTPERKRASTTNLPQPKVSINLGSLMSNNNNKYENSKEESDEKNIPGLESSSFMHYDLNMSLDHTNKIIDVIDNIKNVLNLTLKDHIDSSFFEPDGSGNEKTKIPKLGKDLNFIDNKPVSSSLNDLKIVLDKKLKLNIISQEIDNVNNKACKFEESMSNLLKVMDLKSCIETSSITKERLLEKTIFNLKEINNTSDKRMFIYTNFFNECKQNFNEITSFIHLANEERPERPSLLKRKSSNNKQKSDSKNISLNVSSVNNISNFNAGSESLLDSGLFKRSDNPSKFQTGKLEKVILSPNKKLRKDNHVNFMPDSDMFGIQNSPYKNSRLGSSIPLQYSISNTSKYGSNRNSKKILSSNYESLAFSDDESNTNLDETILVNEHTNVMLPNSQIGVVKKNAELNIPFKVVKQEYGEDDNSVNDLNDSFNERISKLSSRFSREDTVLEFGIRNTEVENKNFTRFNHTRARSVKMQNPILHNENKKLG